MNERLWPLTTSKESSRPQKRLEPRATPQRRRGAVLYGGVVFIAVDLKVIEGLADATARAARVQPDAILAGLVRLWHRCWVDEADVFTRAELGGLFTVLELRPVLAALVSFGFLERARKGSFRVRGAKRYLRLKESRRRGAAKTNALKRRSRALPSDALERSRATLNHALSVISGSSDTKFAQGEEDAF